MRVFARAGVLGLRPGRWHEVDGGDPRVVDLILAGHLTDRDYRDELAPAGPLAQPCCGLR